MNEATLTPCPDCNLSFTCTPEHANLALDLHTCTPCTDSIWPTSGQCQLNLLVQVDQIYAAFRGEGPILWAPKRILTKWERLPSDEDEDDDEEGPKFTSVKRWYREFGSIVAEDMDDGMGGIGPYVRMVSETMSIPMTILWGLQTLYEDDSWTKKQTLEIHASSSYTMFIEGSDISWGRSLVQRNSSSCILRFTRRSYIDFRM